VQIIYHILAILGGVTVVLSALAFFFNNLIRDWLKQHWKTTADLKLQEAKEHAKVATIQPQHYAGDQYDIYIKLWSSLAGLQVTVDALWQSANRRNALLLAKQLRDVRANAQEWSLFFEDDHFKQLQRMIATLQGFHAGKKHLYEIREASDISNYPASFVARSINQQIAQNRDYKEKFEILLEQIRRSFKRKLSGLRGPDDGPQQMEFEEYEL